MKATIVTIFDLNPNYGNRLQNYAVHTIMSQLGIPAETVSYGPSVKRFDRALKRGIHALLRYRRAADKNYWKYHVPKMLAFDRFNRRYIPSYPVKDIREVKPSDWFLLGSDQVWNVTWFAEDDIRKDLFFLTFCKPEQKICISPSFGFDDVPAQWRGFMAEKLEDMHHLCARERSGASIIRELTGREVPVLIDPTLMLDREQWRCVAKPPRKVRCDRPYILTYFLGGCSEEREQELRTYAHSLDAQVYRMQDLSQPDLYVCDPGEFLYMIGHAALILTDSFHACVFSFLFGKPFLVYDREGTETGMMSRIDTLLAKFDLSRKYRNSGLDNTLLECDYSRGFAALESERKKFRDYLTSALNLN